MQDIDLDIIKNSNLTTYDIEICNLVRMGYGSYKDLIELDIEDYLTIVEDANIYMLKEKYFTYQQKRLNEVRNFTKRR